MSFQKSTRVLKQDVLSICGELTDGTSPYDAIATAYLDKVYQAVISGNNIFDTSCQEPWIWAQSRTPILLSLKPAVSGMASLTNESSSGTFAIAPSISLEGRFFSLSGQSDIYKISEHDANSTTFQLDQAYLGDTGNFPYTAHKYDYDVFNDIVIINAKNCKIDFSEGGAELTATLSNGSYSPTALCQEIESKMAAAGGETYTATFNSITRKFTIVQGGTTFSLLFGTGSNAYISTSGVLGYDVEDKTGALTYTSVYALSGISRLSKPIVMHKGGVTFNQAARDSNKIFMIDDNSFVRDYPLSTIGNSLPDKFCVIEQNPDGLWSLRFNGVVQTETRIEVNHIPVARKLKDNINSYPLIPGNFSDILVYGAAHFIQTDKSDSKAGDSATKAIAQLKALISFNRQGSQVAGNNFGRLVARPSGSTNGTGGSVY